MGKAISLFCRSRRAIVGANLMKHQSGKETVRTDELGTCGVGCLARLLSYRNVRVPGIPPQWFLYLATNWFATAGGLGLQSGVDAEEVFRMTVRKTLRSLRRQRQLPLLGNPPPDVGGANRAMDASPTFLALAEAAYAPILRCNVNNVRTVANSDPMQTNAITSRILQNIQSLECFLRLGFVR